jgi:hypothetical protein
MEPYSPSFIEVIDGEYAKGKRIRVPKGIPQIGNEMKTVLEALRFLKEFQEPGDKLLFYCTAVQRNNTRALHCKTLLEK